MYIFWILDGSEVRSIWELRTSGLQECKGNVFIVKSEGMNNNFQLGSKNLKFLMGAAPAPIHLP